MKQEEPIKIPYYEKSVPKPIVIFRNQQDQPGIENINAVQENMRMAFPEYVTICLWGSEVNDLEIISHTPIWSNRLNTENITPEELIDILKNNQQNGI